MLHSWNSPARRSNSPNFYRSLWLDGHETHQKPRGIYIPIIRISLFSGADEFITWEWTFRVGWNTSQPHQNNSEKICPLEKWWPGKKVSKNLPNPNCWWFYVSIEIHQTVNHQTKTQHIQDSEEKSSFWKTSFVLQKLPSPRQFGAPKNVGIVWNKIHGDPRRWG